MRRFAALLIASMIGAPAHGNTGAFQNGMQFWPSMSASAPLSVPNGVWVKPRQTILTISRRHTALFQLDSGFQSKLTGANLPVNEKLYPFGNSSGLVCADVEFVLNKKGRVDDILRHCFLDSNGDRIYDKYFRPKNSGTTSVVDYVVIPNAKKMESIEGIKISKIEIGPKDALPDLHFSFLQRSILTGVELLVCDYEFVDKKSEQYGAGDCISPQFQINHFKLPVGFELFGARFLIKERRGTELFFVQLDPIAPFSLYSRMR